MLEEGYRVFALSGSNTNASISGRIMDSSEAHLTTVSTSGIAGLETLFTVPPSVEIELAFFNANASTEVFVELPSGVEINICPTAWGDQVGISGGRRNLEMRLPGGSVIKADGGANAFITYRVLN